MLDTTWERETMLTEANELILVEDMGNAALEEALRSQAMDKVRELVGDAALADYVEYIEHSAYTFAFSIVQKPIGDLVDTKEYVFNHVFVDQYCNGGCAGDDFAGSVCIPLPDGLYLSFHYVM